MCVVDFCFGRKNVLYVQPGGIAVFRRAPGRDGGVKTVGRSIIDNKSLIINAVFSERAGILGKIIDNLLVRFFAPVKFKLNAGFFIQLAVKAAAEVFPA